MARTKEACQEGVGRTSALWTLWGNVVNLAEKRFGVGLRPESRFSKKTPARSKVPWELASRGADGPGIA